MTDHCRASNGMFSLGSCILWPHHMLLTASLWAVPWGTGWRKDAQQVSVPSDRSKQLASAWSACSTPGAGVIVLHRPRRICTWRVTSGFQCCSLMNVDFHWESPTLVGKSTGTLCISHCCHRTILWRCSGLRRSLMSVQNCSTPCKWFKPILAEWHC